MALLSGIRGLVRRLAGLERPVGELLLEFHVDLDGAGKFLVAVYGVLKGKRFRIENVTDLWHYGAGVELNGKAYTIPREDVEVLLALRSLDPAVRDDGALVCDVYPPVLQYLRKKPYKVRESPRVRKLRISEEPLELALEVDYRPEEGLRVKAGYYDGESERTLKEDELEILGRGPRRFARIGDTIRPLPRELDPDIRPWVEAGERVIPHHKIPEFFTRDLVLLKTKMRAVLTEEAAGIRVLDGPMRPRVRIDVDAPGWLDVRVGFECGGFEIPEEVLKARRKPRFVRVAEKTWVRFDGKLFREVSRRLRALGAVRTERGYRLPLMRFSSLEEFVQEIGGIREVAREYQRFLEGLEGFAADENFRLPPDIEARLEEEGIRLRPYQRAGIHWLTWLIKNHLHGILADDMGLGKTLQTILALRWAYETNGARGPSLVICPKSVIPFWARELERFFPGRAMVYHGPRRPRDVWSDPGERIYITNFETVANDIEVLQGIPFYFVVVDEASFIKNPGTQRARAIKALNAVHRLALTGTPIENRPAELWSLFDFLMRGYLGSHRGFVERYEKPLVRGEAGEAAEDLVRKIRPFILRRTKDQVAQDLPEKIEMEEWCELTEEQRALYAEFQRLKVEPIRERLRAGEEVDVATCILPLITKLKQICDHPALVTGDTERLYGRSEKFDLVLEKLEGILKRGEQAVLFSHFLGMLDLLARALDERGVPYIRIQGDTENRGELIARFNSGEARVALCSLRAAGHGINLTAANHIFHVDRWWNPAVEDQATDRVHRIGQDKTVYVYRILTQGTLEERIARILERKKGIAESVIGAVTGAEMRWSREELLELLKPPE
ncbi:DEAD/DEAH box helicase [Candidatus Bipolaricaulota sp. J31]